MSTGQSRRARARARVKAQGKKVEYPATVMEKWRRAQAQRRVASLPPPISAPQRAAEARALSEKALGLEASRDRETPSGPAEGFGRPSPALDAALARGKVEGRFTASGAQREALRSVAGQLGMSDVQLALMAAAAPDLLREKLERQQRAVRAAAALAQAKAEVALERAREEQGD